MTRCLCIPGRLRPLLLPLLLLLFTGHAAAQLQVNLSIKRRLFVVYEPVVATVTVTNLAGREITLRDEGIHAWFGFQITDADGRLVPPFNTSYHLDPLIVPAGQTIKRSVVLNTLYPITEFGLYRVKANIYFADLGRYFVSPQVGIEVSEGKTIWSQTVGVPEGTPGAGENRELSLLTFRQPSRNYLYARVQNPDGGRVLATYPLGPLIAQQQPSALLDRDNQLHVLQLVGPKTYTYSRIGVNGEFLGQKTFLEVKSRPHLARNASGRVEVRGGQVEAPPESAPDAPAVPKLSDRPPDMPIE